MAHRLWSHYRLLFGSATCEKRSPFFLPASFQKIRLAFIREPVVFNKTIIPVARRALVGSALPQRALQGILRNNLV